MKKAQAAAARKEKLAQIAKARQARATAKLDAAKQKEEALRRKNLDFIVLNSLNDKGAGFAYDTNKVTILTAQGKTTEYPIKSKKLVADDIVEELVSLFKQ
mgnify:CR=1 FL=1